MKIPTPEEKAINLFNEALARNITFQFADMNDRKGKAKADVFLLITNIKIALYELTEMDKVPLNHVRNTEAYYSKVREIVTRF